MDPSLPTSWTPSMTHDLWVGIGVLTAGGVLALEKWRRGVSNERIWALVALAVACVLGTIAATAPKWISETLMRVMDVIMSFPGIALAAVFDCPLLTHDRRLARAASGLCAVEVPSP